MFDLVLIAMFEGLLEKRNIAGRYEKCSSRKSHLISEYLRHRRFNVNRPLNERTQFTFEFQLFETYSKENFDRRILSLVARGLLKRIPNGFMFLPVTCLNLRIGLKSHLHTYIYINIHRQSEVDGHFLSLPWSIYINRE